MRWVVMPTLAVILIAQEPPRPVRWSLRVPPDTGGARRMAELTARIEPGWHLYSLTQPPGGPIATRIQLLGLPTPRLALLERRRPDTLPDAVFGIMSEFYDDSVTIRVPLSAAARPGRRLLVAVTFQACTSRLCLTPRTDTVAAVIANR